MLSMPARYRIRVQGQLGLEWSAWFGGLSLSWQEPDQTVLVGQVVDQAALHGLLNSILLGNSTRLARSACPRSGLSCS